MVWIVIRCGSVDARIKRHFFSVCALSLSIKSLQYLMFSSHVPLLCTLFMKGSRFLFWLRECVCVWRVGVCVGVACGCVCLCGWRVRLCDVQSKCPGNRYGLEICLGEKTHENPKNAAPVYAHLHTHTHTHSFFITKTIGPSYALE